MQIVPADGSEAEFLKLRVVSTQYVAHLNGCLPKPEFWWLTLSEERSFSRETHLRWVGNSWGCLAVAWEDGQVVGYGYGEILSRPDFRSTEGVLPFLMLHELVVCTDVRRQGVGTQLLGYLEGWALERSPNLTSVELNVHLWNNAAQLFYDSTGFVPTMTRMVRAVHSGGPS